jgi:hypothetical protein
MGGPARCRAGADVMTVARRRHRHRKHRYTARPSVFQWWHLALALAVGIIGIVVAIFLLGSQPEASS